MAIFGYVVLENKSQIGLLEQSFKDQIWNRTLGELALERGKEAVWRLRLGDWVTCHVSRVQVSRWTRGAWSWTPWCTCPSSSGTSPGPTAWTTRRQRSGEADTTRTSSQHPLSSTLYTSECMYLKEKYYGCNAASHTAEVQKHFWGTLLQVP